MKKKIKYTDEPMGKTEIIEDFLPPPEKLVFKKEDNVKVTILLSRSNVDFFKRQADKHNTGYKKIIRHILESYAAKHNK